MPQESEALWEILSAVPDRLGVRHWAERLESKTTSREQAVAKVEMVFRDQLGSSPSTSRKGADLYAGVLAFPAYFSNTTPSEEEIAAVITLAEKDYYAHLVLELLFQLSGPGYSERLKVWDRNLYLGTSVAPARPPGTSKYEKVHRNMLIVGQIEQLELAGFRPMRSAESKRPHENSGCDIVRDALARVALNLSYGAIETVWKHRPEKPSGNAIGGLLLQAIPSLAVRREQ